MKRQGLKKPKTIFHRDYAIVGSLDVEAWSLELSVSADFWRPTFLRVSIGPS
jgi:hypothetical protein